MTGLRLQKELPQICRILAVSKLQSLEKVQRLHQQGQMDFAENYVQEAVEKIELAQKKNLSLKWHFIGHLQTNKAKLITGKFDLIHSVDSLRLAKVLAQNASEANPQKILLQVNVAGESSKGGLSPSEAPQVLQEIMRWPSLQITGLMTMPPLVENPEDSRPHFQRLRQLKEDWQKFCPTLRELSMGTSSDFKVAAQEGATWVRLGTILFGERIQS